MVGKVGPDRPAVSTEVARNFVNKCLLTQGVMLEAIDRCVLLVRDGILALLQSANLGFRRLAWLLTVLLV
jgi:hypothetical protein